jgi:glycosyltransferase involved in cell wall biosynthesis
VLHDLSLICPRVTMVNDKGHPCGRQCLRCRAFTFPFAHLSRTVEAVIGVSQDTLDRHLDLGFFPNALERKAIYHGVERPVAPVSLSDRAERIKSRPLVFGFLGRVEQAKGIETLLAALRTLPSDAKWSCRIAGRAHASYLPHLQSMAAGLPVSFLGFADAHAFLASIDILVVPSINPEPYGLVVAEAYSHGVPVIASQTGGLAEIVEHGRTGLQVPPANVTSLAQALNTVLSSPTQIQDFASNALRAAATLTIEREAEDTLQVLQGAIDRGVSR